MTAHYWSDAWRELSATADEDGLDHTTRYAISEAVDCIEDYLRTDEIEHIEALEDTLKAVWPT